jgi:hypothetical protein
MRKVRVRTRCTGRSISDQPGRTKDDVHARGNFWTARKSKKVKRQMSKEEIAKFNPNVGDDL